MKRFILLLLFLSSLLYSSSTFLELQIKGVIGPASSEYLKNGVQKALTQNAKGVLITLDTPGGLSTSMREMIQTITNSPIPIIMYVYPKGSRAASAGTYLLYASHVAAMAPGTNLGAATPINIMPTTNIKEKNGKVTTLERKAMNDAMAYIKSLAEMNDRNVTWALEAVENAKSLSAKEALKDRVIDIVANNPHELFEQLDGKVLKVADEKTTLHIKDIDLVLYKPDWKTEFLSIVTNPNIAYILMLVAIYGIFFELMNPGSVLPGAIGAISGVVALYALNILPFNYAGLLLILLGIAFMITEVFVSGFGILGIGGVISFALGSILLFDADTLGRSISIPLIIAFSLVSLGFFIMLMRLFLHSRSAKVVSGKEEMIGAFADVIDVTQNGYHVLFEGEVWSAASESELHSGERVEVTEVNGLILNVKPIKE